MTKRDLLSYLREVRDTEYKRIECQTQLSKLRGQLSNYTAPSVPELYTPWELPARSIEAEVRSYIDLTRGGRLALFAMIGLMIGFIIGLPNILAGFLFAIPGIILGVLVGALTMKSSARHHVKRQRAKQAREADRRAKGVYKQARAEYPKKMREYRHSVEACQRQIRELEDQLQSVEKHLSRLYAKRLLQPEFLNYQSVNLIYSLLETGICSSLDGPDGAYAYCRAEMRKR